MHINRMFPNHYLKAADLQNRPQVVVIATCNLEAVGDDDKKPVLGFRNTSLKLVLNRTNAETIAELYGEDSDHWIGKAVELYPARVPFRARMVDAIRIRPPTAQRPRPAAPVNEGDDSYTQTRPRQSITLATDELAGPDDDGIF